MPVVSLMLMKPDRGNMSGELFETKSKVMGTFFNVFRVVASAKWWPRLNDEPTNQVPRFILHGYIWLYRHGLY